jgi:hypothetical protein
MITSPISTLHHPTLVSQTDRDPHRERGEQPPGQRRHASAGHPRPDVPAPVEERPSADALPTTGLLLDVKG